MSRLRSCLSVCALVIGALALPGCVNNMYPGGPTPGGGLVTHITSPAQALTVATDASAKPTKRGESSSLAILGLFSFGDSGINAAMTTAGISKVHHVDHRVQAIAYGFWLRTTTIVHGE